MADLVPIPRKRVLAAYKALGLDPDRINDTSRLVISGDEVSVTRRTVLRGCEVTQIIGIPIDDSQIVPSERECQIWRPGANGERLCERKLGDELPPCCAPPSREA